MFCGTRSFYREDDGGGGRSSPAGWSRYSSKEKTMTVYGEEEEEEKKKKKKKNPYSARGLDKFDSLLADLDARKRKITTAHEDLWIWFVYSSAHDWVPRVVKLHKPPRRSAVSKEKKNGRTKRIRNCGESARHSKWETSRGTNFSAAAADGTTPLAVAVVEKEERGRPEARGHYLFWSVWVTMGLILLCLAAFGRSFAVFCTVIWWYLAPVDDVTGTGGSNGGGRRQKDDRRTMRWV